jgi:hypothetical protein
MVIRPNATLNPVGRGKYVLAVSLPLHSVLAQTTTVCGPEAESGCREVLRRPQGLDDAAAKLKADAALYAKAYSQAPLCRTRRAGPPLRSLPPPASAAQPSRTSAASSSRK